MSIPNLINIHSAVLELLDVDLRTERHGEANKRFFFFQIFVANMRKLMRHFKCDVPTYLSIYLLHSGRRTFRFSVLILALK
jgi:hypothetical protein